MAEQSLPTGPMSDDEIRRALAEALAEADSGYQPDPTMSDAEFWAHHADALLPVVRRAQATALRDAATYWDRPNIRTIASDLRERAQRLDPQ